MKICNNKDCHKAGELQELSAFGKDKNRKDGHTYVCKKCKRDYRSKNIDVVRKQERDRRNKNKIPKEDRIKSCLTCGKSFKYIVKTARFCSGKCSKKDYHAKNKKNIQEYRAKNKERIAATTKKHRVDNPEYHRNRQKKYNSENREKVIARRREWERNNPNYRSNWNIKNKERALDIGRRADKKRRSDPLYIIKSSISSRIRRGLSKLGCSKKSRTHEIVGCDYEFLYNHLLTSFIKNYDREPLESDDIHIDHIVPMSSAKTEEEVLRLNHYSNLQWLLAKDNLNKSDKLDWEL